MSQLPQTRPRQGVELVHRPARTSTPARFGDVLDLERPPQVDESGQGGMGFLGLIPLLGAAGSMTVMMLFRGSPFAAVGALMMIVTVTGAVVMMFSQRGKAGRRRRTLRDQYLEYLERRRYEHLAEEQQIRSRARSCDPEPEALLDIAADPHRLWERRRSHEDFMRLRLGTGSVPARDIRLQGESESGQRPDPHMQQEMQNIIDRFSTAPDMPVLIDLRHHGSVSIVGDRAFGHQVLRNLLLPALVFHSPEDLHLAAAVPQRHTQDPHEDSAEGPDDEWGWLALVPHILDQSRPTEFGPLNRLAPDLSALRDLLDEDIRRRYQKHSEVRKNFLVSGSSLALPRLLVIDMTHEGPAHDIELPDTGLDPQELAITSLHMVQRQQDEPENTTLRITQTGDGFAVEDYRHDPLEPRRTEGYLQQTDPSVARGLARTLSPLRLSPDSLEHSEEIDSQRFTSYLGIRDFSSTDVERLWRPRELPDFLKVPIGVDDRGRPVKLDLKESAQHGMGPHGLCVGATGSGKSELLRTMVLGLAVTHPPDLLNMVLVDYKGGATFAPFEGVPHVSGIVTNLSDDSSLVDRIYASLEGEVQRRQQVLKDAGNVANITEYQARRREKADEGEDLPPLPHLFVVIDEFGELLTAQPDFIDLFMSIGRIGRSIGVHLLLSSQRIEAGKLRGLDTHLSYRLGLRTLSEGESRTVLETPDAFHLPPLPGYGYLKVDTTTYARFKAGYVSGPLSTETQDDDEQDEDREPAPAVPAPFYAEQLTRHLDSGQDEDEAEAGSSSLSASTSAPTVMSSLVEVMRGFERATPPIWLPPLPGRITLDQVADRGSTGSARLTSRTRQLTVPVGILDDPGTQWQGAWELDLTRSGGNLIFLGGPSSGKTTALRTTALSLAHTHSVREVALFGIDLRGSALQPLAELPHSAGMASRNSREALRRTVEEVSDLLEEREQLFERRGIDTLATMREMHAADELEELEVADVILLIDGWGALTGEFEDLQEQVYGILARGGNYGVHVVATGSRWNEVRIAQQTFFGNRIELRLSEPAESAHGRKVAERIPANRPGEG
ncbi:type VII secretion protein EccCa [Nesterenkonia sp. F]|uniref:type VII secretion protein EccCa n=1 Tax=Nesterenkonia sp. F TaxID=795955 RepID=UPI001ED8C47D|nr:type VII secretion protein EccCa [Nesterenkonia sp. F]